MLQGNESDSASAVNDTLDFAFIYMFFITLSIFPEIPQDNILDHRVALLIVSNAFLSYKKQTHKMGKICLLKINIKLNDYK